MADHTSAARNTVSASPAYDGWALVRTWIATAAATTIPMIPKTREEVLLNRCTSSSIAPPRPARRLLTDNFGSRSDQPYAGRYASFTHG